MWLGRGKEIFHEVKLYLWRMYCPTDNIRAFVIAATAEEARRELQENKDDTWIIEDGTPIEKVPFFVCAVHSSPDPVQTFH